MMKGVPKSYDVIGDIIIVEIPEQYAKKEKQIAELLLRKHKHAKVIAKKAGKHAGRYRTQKLKIIAGERRKETVHKESAATIKLNVESCYFSPRSSTERARIARLVRPGEKVLVMFSGVAPFPLVIAKNAKPKEIHAIEINPKAHKYAEENVKLNKIKNIRLHLGDVRKIVPKLKKKFDRIIMPLPKTAGEFLDLAKGAARKGATVHYYTFGKEEEFGSIKEKLRKTFPKARSMDTFKCGQYSPYIFRLCVDIKLP